LKYLVARLVGRVNSPVEDLASHAVGRPNTRAILPASKSVQYRSDTFPRLTVIEQAISLQRCRYIAKDGFTIKGLNMTFGQSIKGIAVQGKRKLGIKQGVRTPRAMQHGFIRHKDFSRREFKQASWSAQRKREM
jgi:hypothetical protein